MKNHDRDVPGGHFLVMQVRRVMFDGIFPQEVVLCPFCRACLDRNGLSPYLDRGSWACQQVMIPAGIVILAPVGADQEVKALREKISDGGNEGSARFCPLAMQQENGLHAKLAADSPMTDPDGEYIHRHKNFQRKPIHAGMNPLSERFPFFAWAEWT